MSRSTPMTDTRTRLLLAAAEALRRDGIAGLSARTIATRAGVNQSLVFYHFGTMGELVQAATIRSVDESVGYYRERLAAVTSLTDLLAVGRELHERERDLGNVKAMAQLMAGAQQDLMLAEAARYAMARWTDEIETVIRRVLSGSPLADVVDLAGLAQAVSSGFIGLELYDGVDPVGGRAAADAIESLGALLQVLDDLGPIAARAVRSRVRKGSARPG